MTRSDSTPWTDARLSDLRRELHQYPEPGWREFETTGRLVEEIEAIGVDELAVGREAYDPADRMAVPDPETIEPWVERARDRGVRADVLERTRGGVTGCVAVLDRGAGPSVGLRVDIDGLLISEATDGDHRPVEAGFRSAVDGTMHACGHDVHMTWGIAVLEAVAASDFQGRLVVFFQPAEELSGGGHPMAESRFAADLDALFAAHVGLDHPTGTVVAGIERPLAMAHVRGHVGTRRKDTRGGGQRDASARNRHLERLRYPPSRRRDDSCERRIRRGRQCQQRDRRPRTR